MSFKKFTLAALCALLSLGSAQTTGGFLAATQCTPETREGEFCSLVGQPVCGYKPDIVCADGFPTNCNYATYSNACEACHDAAVASYTKGMCPQ